MSDFFRAILLKPLYNGFILLMDMLPWLDAGIIIILFTILVKLVLFPVSRKAVKAQMELRAIEPELSKIRTEWKDNKQEQARRTLELYQERKINPFSSLLVILIQIPIILALYFVFLRSGLPALNGELLYSFIPRPETINMHFLGLVDITGKNIILALLAGITSFFQIRFSTPALKKKEPGGAPSFRDDLARSMNMQMRYVFPVIVFFISYSISGVIALYWMTSNLFTLGQEVVIRRHVKKENPS